MAEATLGPANLSYVESWLAEDEPLAMARAPAHHMGPSAPLSPGGGATLRFLAAAVNAKAIVEVGTGAGASGLWLMRGMRPDGVLTTVDVEPEHQRAAREAYLAAGIAPKSFRLIPGQALEVLPRLSDGAYDLVFVDADKTSYNLYLTQAVRLLRPGGLVVFDNTLRDDQVAQTLADRDSAAAAVRELLKSVRDDETLVPALLPVGDGLLAAVRR